MNAMHDYVVAQILESPLSYREIADGSGVAQRTVEKIGRREIADPGVSHIQKLHDWFKAREKVAV